MRDVGLRGEVEGRGGRGQGGEGREGGHEGGREAEKGKMVAHGPAAGLLLLRDQLLFVSLEVGGRGEGAGGRDILREKEGGKEGRKEGEKVRVRGDEQKNERPSLRDCMEASGED